MPTQFGSADLSPIAKVATGVYGLNLQESASLLDPKWATQADNMYFNNLGVLTSRFGWGTALNATPMSGSPAIRQIFEYTPITGSNQIISTGGNKIYKGTTTLTDITGSLTVSADNWKFVNFNGNCYGLQAGHSLIVYTGTGNFTAVTAASGSVPNGNELLSAFGRLWGADSTGQVLQYSQLLDATNWNVTGAGSFNLTSVWGNGNDKIVALAAFNNFLVVFGSNNIIVWTDGTGSVLGMNPVNMFVQDMVAGIGCYARDSVKSVNGDDVVLLTYFGLQSLKRLFIERSNPIRNISVNVRDAITTVAHSEPPDNVKATFDAVSGFYLISFPSSQNVFVFDTKVTLQDGSWRCTQWNNFYPQAIITLHDGDTTYAGSNGQLFKYGDQDSTTVDPTGGYTASYSSVWFDLEDLNTRLKMLKRVSSVFSTQNSGTINIRWQYDFSGVWSNYQVPVTTSAPSYFGVAFFGLSGFGGGLSGTAARAPASGVGQYIKIGADFFVSTNQFVLQQMEMYAKIGRII